MTSIASDVGAVGGFRDGAPQRVVVNGRALVVVRKGSEFFALREACPHAGASLSRGRVVGLPRQALPGNAAGYEREGEILTCPWHGWSFDLRTGRSLVKPEKVRVRAYAVSVRDGRVCIHAD